MLVAESHGKVSGDLFFLKARIHWSQLSTVIDSNQNVCGPFFSQFCNNLKKFFRFWQNQFLQFGPQFHKVWKVEEPQPNRTQHAVGMMKKYNLGLKCGISEI